MSEQPRVEQRERITDIPEYFRRVAQVLWDKNPARWHQPSSEPLDLYDIHVGREIVDTYEAWAKAVLDAVLPFIEESLAAERERVTRIIHQVPQHHGGERISMTQYRQDVLDAIERGGVAV